MASQAPRWASNNAALPKGQDGKTTVCIVGGGNAAHVLLGCVRPPHRVIFRIAQHAGAAATEAAAHPCPLTPPRAPRYLGSRPGELNVRLLDDFSDEAARLKAGMQVRSTPSPSRYTSGMCCSALRPSDGRLSGVFPPQPLTAAS